MQDFETDLSMCIVLESHKGVYLNSCHVLWLFLSFHNFQFRSHPLSPKNSVETCPLVVLSKL